MIYIIFIKRGHQVKICHRKYVQIIMLDNLHLKAKNEYFKINLEDQKISNTKEMHSKTALLLRRWDMKCRNIPPQAREIKTNRNKTFHSSLTGARSAPFTSTALSSPAQSELGLFTPQIGLLIVYKLRFGIPDTKNC